jgi:glycosyltransferase involved in cell wall biosynthesis
VNYEDHLLQTVVIIPCFNEAQRLDVDAYLRFAVRTPCVRLLFVNDGSHDGTIDVLHQLRAQRPEQFAVCDLRENQGKAEAVRQGVLHAAEQGPRYVGYWDADLATPLESICDFRDVLEVRPNIDVVLGSRMPLVGRDIQRHPLRRILGRCFASVASRVLRLPLYDTQCGAKLFRVTRQTISAFQTPFEVRWIFDVELLARLGATHNTAHEFAASIYELPLQRWQEIPGSKVKPRDFVVAVAELGRIAWRYSRRLRSLAHSPTTTQRLANHAPGQPAPRRRAA